MKFAAGVLSMGNWLTTRSVFVGTGFQFAVIILGTLAAPHTRKWGTEFRLVAVRSTLQMAADHGRLTLVFPAAWGIAAIVLIRREESSDRTRALAILMGIGLLIVLVVAVCVSAIREWWTMLRAWNM